MPGFRPNPAAAAEWKAQLEKLAQITGKSDPAGLRKLATLSAKRFVKNVADITPPARGKADTAAKKAGENAIVGDLLKLAIPTQAEGLSRAQAREVFASAEELTAAHARAFSKADGRVNPRNRKSKLTVERRDFDRVAKQLMARVGWLAAGLNAAAAKLGFKLPSWIARHGEKFGKIEVLATAQRIRIRITQNVPYADNIRGYTRKWDFAIKKEVRSLAAQVKVIVEKKIKAAARRLR